MTCFAMERGSIMKYILFILFVRIAWLWWWCLMNDDDNLANLGCVDQRSHSPPAPELRDPPPPAGVPWANLTHLPVCGCVCAWLCVCVARPDLWWSAALNSKRLGSLSLMRSARASTTWKIIRVIMIISGLALLADCFPLSSQYRWLLPALGPTHSKSASPTCEFQWSN